ncbi:MAG: 16S rRNA (cytosine(967)-C(5))-methyltransferase, partial [Nitrospirae bacterium]
LLARLRPGGPEPPPLAELLDRTPLPAADRRLLHALYLGVCRNRPWLDHCLAPRLDRPLSALDPVVLDVLRLGAFQLLCLERVPDHAAVAESVALCRAAGAGRAAGLVNAVLRRLARDPLPPPAPPGAAGLALATGMPAWLAERFAARHGLRRARAWLAALNTPPPGVCVRLNPLRADPGAVRARLAAAGLRLEPAPLGRHALRVHGAEPRRLPGLAEGWLYPQDAASQWVAELLDPAPGSRLLDACAAPGGKASHLAALAGPEGRVVAVERDPGRARRLAANLERLGAEQVEVVVADAAAYRPGAPFDAILLDAPCTGLGVLRRHPEIRWRRTPEAIAEAAALQGRLLAAVARHLRPGGRLVYAVCSTEPEEGEAVVAAFLASHPHFRPDPLDAVPAAVAEVAPGGYRTLPHRAPVDAFFAARLRRLR